MPSTLRPAAAGENVRTSELCSTACDVQRSLRASSVRAHAQLGVDAGQVARHGAIGEEECGGTSAFVGPRPRARPPRRSAAVRPSLAVRPPIRPASARARAATDAPSSSKPACAASIASRAPRFCRARRRATRAPAALGPGRRDRPPRRAARRRRPGGTGPSRSHPARRRPVRGSRSRARRPSRDRAGAHPLPTRRAARRRRRRDQLEQRLDLVRAPPAHARLDRVGRIPDALGTGETRDGRFRDLRSTARRCRRSRSGR